MESLNPFGTGQCLSTKVEDQLLAIDEVSIPLEQGNVFRLDTAEYATDAEVSIPLEQGNVFRHKEWKDDLPLFSGLNPFGTGQCLSTFT